MYAHLLDALSRLLGEEPVDRVARLENLNRTQLDVRGLAARLCMVGAPSRCEEQA